jgi:leader peptidase (prepilin peptidase)/N-methyltransferase
VVEALTASLFAAAFLAKGFPEGLFWPVFCALLVVIFWIDVDEMLILHVTTVPGILLGIGFNIWTGHWVSALLAAVAGFAFFEGIYYLSLWILKKEGMGQGDSMLAAMMGAWLGPWGLLVALYLSFFILLLLFL